MKICNGASTSNIQSAIEKEVFTIASRRPFNRCHAAVAQTSKAETRKAAIPIWNKRYGNEGLNIIASQSCGTMMPFSIAYPAGVCIQLLEDRIQNIEIQVPRATIRVAKKWALGPTLPQPNNIIPKKPASRKNAVNTS